VSALEGVEDIPGVVIADGLDFTWETFPEFMNELEKLNTAVDFMAYVAHVPLRIYAMGSDRCHGEATSEDLRKMRMLVREALNAGAAGVSTSRTLLHRDTSSVVIPGTYAGTQELISLFAGMADAGGGLFEILNDFADVGVEFEWIRSLAAAFKIPASVCLPSGSPEVRQQVFKVLEEANRSEGWELLTVQTMLKQQGSLQQIGAPYHPLLGHATFQRELVHLPVAEQLRRLRDPAFKRRILSETSMFAGKPFSQAMFSPFNVYPLVPPGQGAPQYERDKTTETFGAMSLKVGGAVSADELMYDALAEGKVLWAPLTGNSSLEDRMEMFSHPHVKVGLGDGGAHLGIFQESSCPTFMLSHYARDRSAGRKLSLERAVYLQTLDTARLLGLHHDRGTVEVGKRADLNIIDMKRLALKTPTFLKDLPAGGGRWFQGAEGYVMTIMKGVPTFERGRHTGALPGCLVRGRLYKQLSVMRVEDIPTHLLSSIPEPKSTHDIQDDTELTGGASALARAAKANLIAQVGEFLSGQLRTQAKQHAKM
jgi:N-acyl-D-aspartate/D-glutamate deacylase